MVTFLQQRNGPNSRMVAYKEVTPGSDASITDGTVLPIRSQAPSLVSQPTVEAPVYDLSANPGDFVYGMLNAAPTLPLGLEFSTCPMFLRGVLPGYTKTTLPTGNYHDFYLTPPGTVVSYPSYQLQAESAESTAQYIRTRYNRVKSVTTSYAASGVTPFDVAMMGAGDFVTTDLAGTKTYNGYNAVSMFNGQAFINGLTCSGMPQFSLLIDAATSLFGGAFNSGRATSVNNGKAKINGNVQLAFAVGGSGPEADLAFFNYAANQQRIPINCMWADGPLASMTAFMDLMLPTNRFTLSAPPIAGEQGLMTSQRFDAVYNATNSKVAAWVHGTTLGTFNISASNDQFKYNIDGSGATVYVLTHGAARTVAQIVTELNADATFTAKAVADSYGGYLRVMSKTKGSTSSVQFVTVTSDSNATLGFNTTAIAGYDTACLVRVWSPISTSF